MVQIDVSNRKEFTLGRRGENLARQVVFDLSGFVAEYGPGVAELIYQRPGDAAPYPAAAVREGDTLLWTPTVTDTALASTKETGNGHCELRWYVGDLLAKSQMWRVWVDAAMDTPSETTPPEPQKGWVDQVLAVEAAAKAQADAAKLSADNAAQAAQQAAENAEKCVGLTDDVHQLKEELADIDAWQALNDFDSETGGKTNVMQSPFAIDDMLNNSIILSSGYIRTEGMIADKGNLMSPLIEINEGVYGLKVKCYGSSSVIGKLGNDNNGYGLFAQDGTTPVKKVSMVDKGNQIYLITVPSNAKYIRFVARKGSNDDTNLSKTLEAINSWILLPDATDDIDDDFFVLGSTKPNGTIDKIKRNDGSYLSVVDLEARQSIGNLETSVSNLPITFGRRTCAIFKKVCCIGDSYTAGYIMNSDGTPISDNDYSWVEHMKTLTGRDYVNCGISGASSKTWLTDERGLAKAQIPENKAQAYLIGLQINDANESMSSYVPVGSAEDIGTDAETYYGCMSKIVNEVFAINPLAHIFIQTQPKNYTGIHTPYREAIINIVSHFQNDGTHGNQVHLLDLNLYYKLYQNAGCNDSMVNGHFTAVGWEYCAEILAYAWSNYINQNPLKFQDINLIPYGESN